METDNALVIIDSAVDWISATAKRGVKADSLYAIGQRLLHESEADGNIVSGFRSKGYHGWHSGGITIARRYDGTLLTLTSREAASGWSEVKEASDNVTRLDLQTTVADQTTNASRAEIAYHLMQENRKRAGRPISASLRLNTSGGQTLYLGSERSDVRGRLYDKGIEAKVAEAGACWRYETQFRREPARRVSDKIYSSKAVHDSITALVVDYFSNRGVVVPQTQRVSSREHLQHESLYLSRRETDADRSLRWLNTFVASTVRRLIVLGRRDEVMRALGLNDEADGAQPRDATIRRR